MLQTRMRSRRIATVRRCRRDRACVYPAIRDGSRASAPAPAITPQIVAVQLDEVPIIDFYLGKRAPEGVLSASANVAQDCEARFYVGEWHLLHSNTAEAKSMLRTAD